MRVGCLANQDLFLSADDSALLYHGQGNRNIPTGSGIEYGQAIALIYYRHSCPGK